MTKKETSPNKWLCVHASLAARGKFAPSQRTGEFAGTASIAYRYRQLQIKKMSKNLWLVLLFIGLNCSEYNQNRNSRSEIESLEQKIMLEKWSQLDTLKQKVLGVDQIQTLKDSIISIELVKTGLHQFYFINLSNSKIRLSLYSIEGRCNPFLYPSVNKPDSSCIKFYNNRIGEISDLEKIEIIKIISQIYLSNNNRLGAGNCGNCIEIKTNFLSQNSKIALYNPNEPIFKDLVKRLNRIDKKE